ncbi:hypothetical protein R4I97_11765 [Brachyspira pilosicoli]|uniref:hypothetical protein n=1 Tax=Brachyspira pilosicoli TaxID=52584 RepID=UPI003004184A
MQKQIKILLTLLMSLALAVSCASPTDPTDQNNQQIVISPGVGSRGYRFVADEAILNLDWTNQNKADYFKTNWMNTFTNQTIYKEAALTTITGYTDAEANYYDKANYPDTVRTRFKFVTNVTDNGKEYIGAVYYDEGSYFGNLWRLIYITENGEEQAFWGNGNNDPNTVPTSWSKYNFFFGYIKIN